jgi:hypothetical protein
MLVAVAFAVCLAQCPIQVDQLPTTPDGLSGTSVAIEGDLAVIGCPIGTGNGWASGMVIVYRLVNNVWQREAELIAKDGAVGDMMGVSVDVSEGRIIAGAWFNNHAGTNSGAAYIFEQVNGLWVQTTKLIAKDAYTQDSFGRRVAIEGDVCVVTAPLDDDNGASSGSAYVYQFDNTWFQLQKLTAKGGTGGDQFGLGLAMDGERILIGAPFANEGRGNAYLFDRANVMFVESEVFSDPNGEPADNFSFSMDVDGDNVAIGSYLDDDVAPDAGSVFMFAPGIDGWDLSQHIVPTNGFSTDEQFGVSIAMHGSVMLVGSRFALIDGLQAGEVNVFDSVNSYWNKRSSIISPEPTIEAEFGWSVAIDGDYGIAGAPWLEPDGEVQFYNGFITSCECLGDVDGDGSVGVTDLLQLIGAWGVCANCDEDLNGNGVVEVSDILELISFWGTCQ